VKKKSCRAADCQPAFLFRLNYEIHAASTQAAFDHRLYAADGRPVAKLHHRVEAYRAISSLRQSSWTFATGTGQVSGSSHRRIGDDNQRAIPPDSRQIAIACSFGIPFDSIRLPAWGDLSPLIGGWGGLPRAGNTERYDDPIRPPTGKKFRRTFLATITITFTHVIARFNYGDAVPMMQSCNAHIAPRRRSSPPCALPPPYPLPPSPPLEARNLLTAWKRSINVVPRLRTPKLVISVMKRAAYRRWLSDKAGLLHRVRFGTPLREATARESGHYLVLLLCNRCYTSVETVRRFLCPICRGELDRAVATSICHIDRRVNQRRATSLSAVHPLPRREINATFRFPH